MVKTKKDIFFICLVSFLSLATVALTILLVAAYVDWGQSIIAWRTNPDNYKSTIVKIAMLVATIGAVVYWLSIIVLSLVPLFSRFRTDIKGICIAAKMLIAYSIVAIVVFCVLFFGFPEWL